MNWDKYELTNGQPIERGGLYLGWMFRCKECHVLGGFHDATCTEYAKEQAKKWLP